MDRRAAIDRYASGYDAVAAALEGITETELDHRPADGGWTAREVVHHLADSEARSMLRLRQLVAGDIDVIEAYDQDRWAAALPYHLPIDAPLAVVAAVRALSLATLEQLDDGAWDRAAAHPEHPEPYTVERWLGLYSEHPHDHAAQIAAARREGASVG
jgi:hypothetical protein